MIALDGGDLILETIDLEGNSEERRIYQGLVSFDKGVFIFNFFDGKMRIRIKVDPKGRAFFNYVQIEDEEGVSFGKLQGFTVN